MDYFEADHSKKRNNRNQAKPAQGWPCNPAALPAQKLPFLSPDSPTRSYMHAAEGVTRQVRVQRLVPCICVHQRASDCFKLS